MDDPIADARDLVAESFPDARWALLTGSVITAMRTAGSDLDIVVVLADGDPRAPQRLSRRYRTWPVEMFVHDGRSLAQYLARDLPARRPVMHRMIATGIPLIDTAGTTSSGSAKPSADAEQQRFRADCARVLAAGPEPLSDAELEWARYALTDAVDDLIHARDDGERTAIATAAWNRSAEVALGVGRHWAGTGKWLLRELRDLDADLAARWLAAAGDPDAVIAFARDVLERAGGPLFAGYTAAGERTS